MLPIDFAIWQLKFLWFLSQHLGRRLNEVELCLRRTPSREGEPSNVAKPRIVGFGNLEEINMTCSDESDTLHYNITNDIISHVQYYEYEYKL